MAIKLQKREFEIFVFLKCILSLSYHYCFPQNISGDAGTSVECHGQASNESSYISHPWFVILEAISQQARSSLQYQCYHYILLGELKRFTLYAPANVPRNKPSFIFFHGKNADKSMDLFLICLIKVKDDWIRKPPVKPREKPCNAIATF